MQLFRHKSQNQFIRGENISNSRKKTMSVLRKIIFTLCDKLSLCHKMNNFFRRRRKFRLSLCLNHYTPIHNMKVFHDVDIHFTKITISLNECNVFIRIHTMKIRWLSFLPIQYFNNLNSVRYLNDYYES